MTTILSWFYILWVYFQPEYLSGYEENMSFLINHLKNEQNMSFLWKPF